MTRDLTVSWPPGALTTDPRLAYNAVSKTFARQCFESLVDVDPDSGRLRPWLASQWHCPDPLTVRMVIRSDRRFADGSMLTAADVRRSFESILELAEVAPQPFAVAALTGLSDVESSGETVTFRFDRHDAAFLPGLASVNLAVGKSADDGVARLGTGPWAPLDATTLTDGRRRLRFVHGDATADLHAGPPPADGYHVADLRNPGIGYGLCPNISRGPLADLRVRRALSLLIDRDRLRPILDRCGYGVADSVLTPPTPYHRDCSAELTHDPAQARHLLAAAGADGLRLTVVYNASFSPIDTELLSDVAAQWAEHGVELELADVDFPELRERQLNGDYDFRFFYYTATDPDALRFQFAVAQRNVNRRGAPDRLDALLDAQLQCADPDERRNLVHDIQKLILTDGWWLPIGTVRTVVSHRPDTAVTLDSEGLARI